MTKLEAGSIIRELDLNYNEVRTGMIRQDIEVKQENIVLTGKGFINVNGLIDTSEFMEDDELLVRGFENNIFLIIKKELLHIAWTQI